MTKQELIEQAYGEYWNEFKQYINSNGWLHCNYLFPLKAFMQGQYEWLVDNGMQREYWRPLSLHGIEDNNGWIKIIEGDELKNLSNSEQFHGATMNFVFTTTFNKEQLIEKYYNNEITHYKPIADEPLPLY